MQKVQDYLNPYADKASYLKWWSFFLLVGLMAGNCFIIAFGPATLSLWGTGDDNYTLLGITITLVYSAALMFFISALVYQCFHYPTTLENNWLVFPHNPSHAMGPFDHKLAKIYAKTYSKPTWEGDRDATIVKANSRMEANKKAKEIIK